MLILNNRPVPELIQALGIRSRAMSKPLATPTTKPDTTTTPADTAAKPGGNGATEAVDPDAPETPQPGTRPLTVLVSEKTYRHLRMLAAAEGDTVSSVVIEAVERSINQKLRAALAALTRDLG